jgi:hypothetical protein
MADSNFQDSAANPAAIQVENNSTRQVEKRVAAHKEDAAARLNQQMSVCVTVVVLGIGGLMAFQNRESFALPDRNKIWSDFWTKKLSDKSGFPEMKSPNENEWSNIKFEALTPTKFELLNQSSISTTSTDNTFSSPRSAPHRRRQGN